MPRIQYVEKKYLCDRTGRPDEPVIGGDQVVLVLYIYTKTHMYDVEFTRCISNTF